MGEEPPRAPRIVRFAEFALNLHSGELWRSGTRVTLTEQPRQVLTALLERPGELVTRDELRRRLWSSDTFVDFEHGLNAAVKRLRETLGDSADSPRFVETLPRRGYRFIAAADDEDRSRPHVARALPEDGGPPSDRVTADARVSPAHRLTRLRLAALLAVAVVAALSGWLARARGTGPPATPPAAMTPFTLLTGSAVGATFSPDDAQVAFAWNGEAQDNWDIYVKVIGASDVRRLTSHPDADRHPRWSPDGRLLAYARLDPDGNGHLRLMSALGGADQALTDVAVGLGFDWTPDGRYLMAAAPGPQGGLDLVPTDGSEPRRVLAATPGGGIVWPAVSPDGRVLAFASCVDPVTWMCDVFTAPLDATFAPRGAPTRLTRASVFRVWGLTWTHDSTSVVFGMEEVPRSVTLWRADKDGRHEPKRIDAAGIDAAYPAVSRRGDRLIFSRRQDDSDVYRLDVAASVVRPVATSSGFDGNPQLSPDGRQVTFCSNRSGDALAVWIVGADGSSAQRLTHPPGTFQCSPTWSPDGRHIAFDSQADTGEWRIWTIDLESRRPRRLTDGPGGQIIPTWSRDGRWIYFSWERGGGRDIWRIGVTDGAMEQVTHGGGGWVGRESTDGRSILYQPGGPNSAVLEQPLDGGPARTILPCVTGSAYSVVAAGIYYVPCTERNPPDLHPPVRVLDAAGADRQVATLDHYLYEMPSGFAASSDGSVIFYGRRDRLGADLMMIEHFR